MPSELRAAHPPSGRPAIQELKQYFNDDQIVELTLTICIANFTNRFNDAMLCTPDIP